MRGNKNKGIVKVLGIGLTAAVLSFTLTGVAENAVTGAVSGKSVSDGLRQLTALSVMLAVPVNEFDGRDEDTVHQSLAQRNRTMKQRLKSRSSRSRKHLQPIIRQAVRRILPVKRWCRSTLPPM